MTSDRLATMDVVKVIWHPDGKRRVEIRRAPKGWYEFEDLYWNEEHECWIPGWRYSRCMADTAERAEAEARDRVPWLSEMGADGDTER